MDYRRFNTPWNGWTFWENYLVDPNGNRYSPEQIKTSFYTFELARELRGSTFQILSLKQELTRRLNAKPPEIIIRWDGQETVINPPLWKSSK